MTSKVQLNVWVAPEDREFLKARAADRGMSVSELIRNGVAALKPAEADPSREALDRAAQILDDHADHLQGLDRRLSRLEEMAGL